MRAFEHAWPSPIIVQTEGTWSAVESTNGPVSRKNCLCWRGLWSATSSMSSNLLDSVGESYLYSREYVTQCATLVAKDCKQRLPPTKTGSFIRLIRTTKRGLIDNAYVLNSGGFPA